MHLHAAYRPYNIKGISCPLLFFRHIGFSFHHTAYCERRVIFDYPARSDHSSHGADQNDKQNQQNTVPSYNLVPCRQGQSGPFDFHNEIGDHGISGKQSERAPENGYGKSVQAVMQINLTIVEAQGLKSPDLDDLLADKPAHGRINRQDG